MGLHTLTREKLGRWGIWLAPALWGLTMIALPLTTFPLIYRLTGATVAPFSAIPLALLALVWFVPYLLRRGKLPRETMSFIVFTLLVIGLAALAFFQVDDYFRSKALFSQTIRTFVPFGIGLTFFLIASAWHRDRHGLHRTLQFIHIGGFFLLVWAVAQAFVVFGNNYQYPPIMQAVFSTLVTQSTMTGNPRLAGLTWEASWFAHQLNMLYLPLWMAATYQRTTVFPRIWKISIENIFLVVGLVVFFLSSPRIGAAASMLMLFFLFLKFNLAVYRWILLRLERKWSSVKRSLSIKIVVGIGLAALFIGVYFGFSLGMFKVISQRDWRVALIVNAPLDSSDLKKLLAFNEDSLFFVGQRFAFLERTVYWMDGWRIFNDHPFLGVGLGNAGYYFISHLPAIGMSTYEVRTVVYRNDSLPNTKSMWYRLLAETGIVGFSIFLAWLIGLWSSAAKSLRSVDPAIKTVALAGELALLAYIFEGFSVDSFGLPYLFVMAGLVAAAGAIYRRERAQKAAEGTGKP